MSKNPITGLKESITKDILAKDLLPLEKDEWLKYILEKINVSFNMGKNVALTEVMNVVGSLAEK